MLPAADLADILANLSALNLRSNTAAQILAAVLAPLLRSSGVDPVPAPAIKRTTGALEKRRSKRRGSSRRRKYKRHAPTEARDRALAALAANPEATTTEIAKVAKVSRSTALNARKQADKQARKEARKATSTPAKPDRRQRAQQFLREQLARGPKPASAVEEAAAKAHIGGTALDQARAELGIVTSRANAGGVQAVQWSLPG